jgi:hypothetical protein
MQQESDSEIRREIHFIGIQRSKYGELIRIEYIDFSVWFLDRFILFWDSIDPSDRGFGESVWQSSAVLSLMSRFPIVKAQIIIHAVFPFFWG